MPKTCSAQSSQRKHKQNEKKYVQKKVNETNQENAKHSTNSKSNDLFCSM